MGYNPLAIIVTLRTYTRAIIVRNFGHDDYAMLVALVNRSSKHERS